MQIRIWARKEAVKNGYVDYALNITGQIFSFLEDVLNVSYPLPKTGEMTFFSEMDQKWLLMVHRNSGVFLQYSLFTAYHINGKKPETLNHFEFSFPCHGFY